VNKLFFGNYRKKKILSQTFSWCSSSIAEYQEEGTSGSLPKKIKQIKLDASFE
jgi:hypothetical protein